MYTNSEIDASVLYKSSEQLDFAETACRNDIECFGIFDEKCDNDGPFLQIKRGFIPFRKKTDTDWYTSGCVYKKKEYAGKKNRTVEYHLETFKLCRVVR